MSVYVDNPRAINYHCARCEANGIEIGEDAARAIADAWANDPFSSMAAFAANGTFNRDALMREVRALVDRFYWAMSTRERQQIEMFTAYVMTRERELAVAS